jgi:hypothetical protein
VIAVVMLIGLVLIVLSVTYATDCVDAWHHNRAQPKPTLTPHRREVPPFLTSPDQCINCGRDDELLNLERRCFYCHEKHYANG